VPEADLDLFCGLDQVRVNADPDLTVKALSKLISFCARNGSARILIELFEEGGDYCIKVPHRLKLISNDSEDDEFGKLQFMQKSEDNENKGGALSLALCKTIITQMKGKLISISAAEDGGGLFKISLPKIE